MTVPVEGGVLPVDKPVGPTSHDIVGRARRALGTRRIGHTGTLDPFASGLLLLCVGPATRLSQYLTGEDKEYVARARLGTETDTLDREGTVVSETGRWRDVTPEALESALEGLRGRILQRPPRFSAKKIRGEAAHRRARRGEEVELEPVPVTVYDLEVLAYDPPDVDLKVSCSSGTYIRALARDLGEAVGVGAHLTALRRTRVGSRSVDGAVSGDFGEPVPPDAWITPLEALVGWPRVEVDGDTARRIVHGQRVPPPAGSTAGAACGEGDRIAVVVEQRLLAVARFVDGRIRPERVFPHVLEGVP